LALHIAEYKAQVSALPSFFGLALRVQQLLLLDVNDGSEPRQPNSCCGEISLRRAASEITTPSAMLSDTIRSFTASGHDRRRSTPVITSTRWTRSDLVSSLSSKLWSKRSGAVGGKDHPSDAIPEGGRGAALTFIAQALPVQLL